MAGLKIHKKRDLHLWRWIILLILLVTASTGGWYVYQWYNTGEEPPFIPVASADASIDESDVSQEEIDTYDVPAQQPRYISIPSLNLERARVMQVGVTSNNILDVPHNINDTAWYEKSATPGQGYGAVMINGHNGGITKDGVFAELGSLKPDDIITIERGDGEKFSYSVVTTTSMSLEEANQSGMRQLMQSPQADKEGLSLITCDGKWVPRLQQFDRRIMLRAVAIS